MRWVSASLVAIGLAGSLTVAFAACDAETIVLATLDDDDDAGGGSHVRCTSTKQCEPETEVCKIEHGPTGFCVPRPSFCNPDDSPHAVCGKAGVTYWTECYRKMAGDDEASDGPCEETALRCTPDGTECPVNSVCALLGGGNPGDPFCGPPHGTCWSYADCSPIPFGNRRWQDCSGAPGAPQCLDFCHAVQTGRPLTQQFDCDAIQADAGQP